MSKILLYTKIIVAAAILSLSAAMLLLRGFLPEDADYSETTQMIPLVPGNNRIGNVLITISQTGQALRAEKIDRKATHTFLSFRNFRTFLIAGTPFLPLLGLLHFLFLVRQTAENTFHHNIRKVCMGCFLIRFGLPTRYLS